jgi:hypothetical protein
MKTVKIMLEFEKETKGTIRFKETGVGLVDTPKIGTLYVPKPTLKEIGYTEGAKLELNLTVVGAVQ